MKLEMPSIIKEYVDSSNKRDIDAVLFCFSDTPVWLSMKAKRYTGKEQLKIGL